MPLRHELKYQISDLEHRVLAKKLFAAMEPDPNMKPKTAYNVKSLYFDDLENSALEEKKAGFLSAKNTG